LSGEDCLQVTAHAIGEAVFTLELKASWLELTTATAEKVLASAESRRTQRKRREGTCGCASRPWKTKAS
jgi:uncharacterized low-complexity protein